MSWQIIEHPKPEGDMRNEECTLSAPLGFSPASPLTYQFLPARKVKPRIPEFVVDNRPALNLIFHFWSFLYASFPIFTSGLLTLYSLLTAGLSPPCTQESADKHLGFLLLSSCIALPPLTLLLVKISHLALAPIEIPSGGRKDTGF